MKKSLMTMLLAVGLMGSLVALPANAQQDNGGGGGNGGGQNGGGGGGGRQRGGPGGGFNMQQMMQNRLDRIKNDLGASDDDWKALEPKISNVMQLQFQNQMARGRGFQRRGGGNNQDPNANTPTNPIQAAMRELQTTLDNKDATPEQIKSKLEAVRDARKKADENLKKSQDDLRELLTVRQEAVLVSNGILD
jgi:peptidoglycan hydrolase CwlO-like protein